MYGDYRTLNLSEPFPELLQSTNGIQLNTQTDTNCVYNILRVSNFRLKKKSKELWKSTGSSVGGNVFSLMRIISPAMH